MNAYILFLLFFLAISAFVVISLGLNALLGPKSKITPQMQEPFECGADVIHKENVRRIPIRYYAIAIMFILFDLEGVFLYMWAVSATPLTQFMLMAFSIFMILFIWIFAYVWRQKILDI